MEIALIVDTSDNLAASDYPEVKKFIKKIGNVFHVSPHASHVSVVLAGDNIKIPIDFQSSIFGRKYFQQRIDDMKNLGGSWSLDLAFGVVTEKVFSKERGMRDFIPHVAIVITNGHQNQVSHNTLFKVAKKLLDKRVTVYAIGVGDNISPSELRSMVEKESQVYQADTYKDLVNIATDISADICEENACKSLLNLRRPWLQSYVSVKTHDLLYLKRRFMRICMTWARESLYKFKFFCLNTATVLLLWSTYLEKGPLLVLLIGGKPQKFNQQILQTNKAQIYEIKSNRNDENLSPFK